MQAQSHALKANDLDPSNFRLSYFMLDMAIGSNDMLAAELLAEKCFKFDPKNIKAHLNFSKILAGPDTAGKKIAIMERFDYIKDLEKFVKNNPKNIDALKLIFGICCDGAKYADSAAKKNSYHKKSLEYFKQLIKLDPSSKKEAQEELKS